VIHIRQLQKNMQAEKVENRAEPALPETASLDMPRHQLDESGLSIQNSRQPIAFLIRTFLSRVFVVSVTAVCSVYGISEMHGVLSTNSVTYLQWVFLLLFSINFLWISFAFAQALTGFLVCLKPRLVRPPEAEPRFKTAILMPVYNEDPIRIRAAVKAMQADLLAMAPGKYAFFILSDTNLADVWIAEEQAFMDIVNKDAQGCPVYYRRRSRRTERKAGNIANWVKHWGGAYEGMIVLDADSLMSADSMQKLSRRLAAAPGIGMIQTLPTITGAHTLYGRLQQFANNCFGPIYADGLAAWHGLSSNFWGHNAIIRTNAFAEACGLPILPGDPPRGGHVMSHDFIEAAFMRRAGWGVRFDTDIQASFEEAPPSLIDVMIRDRRWCQGNLQHRRFLFARGLALSSRLHLLSGIMSYLSAVFWLSLIIIGLAIAVQASVMRPEYFANPSLFPTWPVFDAERALRLFAVSMVIVLSPKVFGWLRGILNISRCRHFGGPFLLTLSTGFEMLMSALYAPILMVSQVGVVFSVLFGKDTGWKPQSRSDGAVKLKSAARVHAMETLFGGGISVIALLISSELFFWLLPITAGLVLSIPLSWLSGGAHRSKLVNQTGLLRVPGEIYPDPILTAFRYELAQSTFKEDVPALSQLVGNPSLCAWHIAQLPPQHGQRTVFHAPAVTGEWKLRHAQNLVQLERWLEEDETLAMLSSPACIEEIRDNAQKAAWSLA